MNILSLDLGKRIGFCIGLGDKDHGWIHFDHPTKGANFLEFLRWLEKIVMEYQVRQIVMENPVNAGYGQYHTGIIHSGMLSIVTMLAYSEGMNEPILAAPMTLKKFMTGVGRITDKKISKSKRREVGKRMMVDAVNKTLKECGHQQVTDDNEADAIACWLWHQNTIGVDYGSRSSSKTGGEDVTR